MYKIFDEQKNPVLNFTLGKIGVKMIFFYASSNERMSCKILTYILSNLNDLTVKS